MCIEAVEYNEATLPAESLRFCMMTGKANTMSYTANICPILKSTGGDTQSHKKKSTSVSLSSEFCAVTGGIGEPVRSSEY